MKTFKVLCLVLLSLTLVLGSSVLAAKDKEELKDLSLEWKPTKDIRTFKAIDISVFQNAHFAVKSFKDLRKKPAEIGVNIDKKYSERELPVTTKDHVADWLTYHFSKALSNFEIDVVKEKSNFTLEADIIKFYVIEESLYKAEVALKIRLLSKANTVIWEEMISGNATRFGKSYFALNYFETLSDAVLSAVHSLLQNDAFKGVVQKGSARVPVKGNTHSRVAQRD
jgi:hypothetical protein